MKKKFATQKNNFIDKFYVCILIASDQIFQNYAILINHWSFFQGKDFLQLDRFQFFNLN